MTKTIYVEACPGRTVPIHATDNPDGGAFLLAPGEAAKVVDSTNIRRRVRAGDLKLTTAPAAPTTPPSAPSAK